MSIRDRIRSRNGLIRLSSGERGFGRRGSAFCHTWSSYPLVHPLHNRGTSQEGRQTLMRGAHWLGERGRRGYKGGDVTPRQIRPEDASPADPVVIQVDIRVSHPLHPQPPPVFSFPSHPFSPSLSLSLSLSHPTVPSPHTRDLRAWFNASARELRAPYLCTERVYTRLALATEGGAMVKAPVPTISYIPADKHRDPGPWPRPCICGPRILWSLGARRRY